MGALSHVTNTGTGSYTTWRVDKMKPKTSLNQHQSLFGEILPHFDILALKLKS